MSELLATCINPACGVTFAIENLINGIGSFATVTIKGVTTNCPICQGPATVGNGIYSYQNSKMTFKDGPAQTRQKVQQIRDLLKRLKTEEALEKEEVIAELHKLSPAVATIAQKTFTSSDYAAWIAILLSLLTLLKDIHLGYFKQGDKSEVNQEFVNYLLKENAELKSKQASSVVKKQPAKAEAKLMRNGPCSCGSGKKFKKCHGRM